jgi:carbon monoxide dehydrogenase subunit G
MSGATRIDYDVEAALTGKLGSLGQPVLRAKAKEMERQFAARLGAAFATPSPGAFPGPSSGTP